MSQFHVLSPHQFGRTAVFILFRHCVGSALQNFRGSVRPNGSILSARLPAPNGSFPVALGAFFHFRVFCERRPRASRCEPFVAEAPGTPMGTVRTLKPVKKTSGHVLRFSYRFLIQKPIFTTFRVLPAPDCRGDGWLLVKGPRKFMGKHYFEWFSSN